MNISTSYKFLLLFMLSLFAMGGAYAQEQTVSGTISDIETGEVLPGVNVLLKGTSTGTVTDIEGKYRISVPGSESILVYSSIGYATEEVTVGSQATIDLSMAPDIQSLSEIVVTGYSTEERKDVSGAVATVDAEQLRAVPSGNVEQQLQGRVSGVTVITNGQPGTSSVVRVRGFGAFGGNEPLYVVDGVPVSSTDFLQPDDIESTTVLKDAPSASIYGARAANGVIVYTTKKGKRDGQTRVTYDGVFGVTTPGKVNNTLSPQDQADWTWQAIRNTAFQAGTDPVFNHPQYGSGQSPVLPDYINVGGASGVVGNVNLDEEAANYNIDPSKGSIYQVVRANKAGTNWYDELTKPARLNRHMLGFSGGNENSAYYVSLGIQDQEGILINQRLQRYSLRINSEHTLFNRLRIGENIQATYYSVRGRLGGENGRGVADDESQYLSAFRMASIIPVYDEFGGYAGTAAKGFNNPRNPVAELQRQENNRNFTLSGFGNIYAELDLIEGLTFRSSLGGGIGTSYYNYYSVPQYENSENVTSFTYGEGSSFFNNWVFTNTLKYNQTFGMHNLQLLGGIESLNTFTGRNIDGSGLNPFSYDPNYVTLTNTQADGRQVNSSYGLGVNFFSVFGSAKYIYADKYIIGGVLRRDGSSRFGANTRYGVFPAFSAAWRVSEENFLMGVRFISDLKIRGGWGQMGNSNNVDPYNQYSLFASGLGYSTYDINGTNNSVSEGFYRSRIGNPNARWETSTTANVGFDASLFDGKLDVVLDVWRKDTEDLLYNLTLPAVVGAQASSPFINIASMRNEGVDIEVISRSKLGSDLNLELTVNGSFLRNEITSVAPGVPYFDGPAYRGISPIRNQEGRPISSYFGYNVVGLFKNQTEVDNSPVQDGKAIGRFRYQDIDGNDTIDVNDRQYLGDPVPDFTGGLNLRLTYKSLELETFFQVITGVQNYNLSRWFTDFYPSFTGAAIGTRVKDSFVPGVNEDTDVPIFEDASNFSTNTQSNSYYVENGNYGRLANLQISYILPQTVVDKIGADRAKVYVQATNLFTISNYSGLDPGVAGGADTTLGIDIGNPPSPRGFNLGISVGF